LFRIPEEPTRFDLIVSNPPYIGRREAPSLAREVRDHEPLSLSYGGEEGYEFYAGLIAQSAARLRPGGLLVLELGHNSLPAVQPLLEPPLWTMSASPTISPVSRASFPLSAPSCRRNFPGVG